MNVKYFYEFKGLDNVLNRVEILCAQSANATEITATDEPFKLEYSEVDKLEPVQGSQATLGLISKTVFQFLSLHTDDMHGYMVKFYRSGVLYWMGWLDSELYSENLSDFPPYPVEFSAADFNILERLKFRDDADKAFTDINTLVTQLKRCLSKLLLPFAKLYIGCSTTPEGITLATAETALHKLYIQSANFYDEDKEPMSCREVIESILEPFGLMMVQRDANVYIYDYNTLKAGTAMKCYDFDTLNYVGDEAVRFVLGDILEIGTASDSSDFGFDEMINNVAITSSLYANNPFFDEEIKQETLSEKSTSGNVDTEVYKLDYYGKDSAYECMAGSRYAVYTNKENNNTLIGATDAYHYQPAEVVPYFSVKSKDYLIGSATQFALNIKMDAYVNCRSNPFDTKEETDKDTRTKMIKLYCNLFIKDEAENTVFYYDNSTAITNGWGSIGPGGTVESGKFILLFCAQDVRSGNMLNNWQTNSNQLIAYYMGGSFVPQIIEKNYAKGVNVPLEAGINGRIVFEITNKCDITDPFVTGGSESSFHYPMDRVKNMLFNNVSLSITRDGKKANTDDFEFKSYINKKVATDLDERTLKVISANEERLPIGKANLLKKVANHFELQTKFVRSGQTDILERLLMCTIHSNFTTKNKVISVDVRMTHNPVMAYGTYRGVVDTTGMLVVGAELNFSKSITNITVIDYQNDVAKLSSIEYD